MTKHVDRRRRWRALLLGSVAVPLGLAAFAAAPPEELLPTPTTVAPKPEMLSLGLEQLEKLALEKQPAIHAYQASLNAASAKRAALEELHLAGLVRADMNIRKQQADRGIDAADAALRLSKGLTLYSVRRNYWSVVYARQQLAVADAALREDAAAPLSKIKGVLKAARGIIKDYNAGLPGRRDVKDYHPQRLEGMIAAAEGRREEASQGAERATAALREAVGLPPGCKLVVTAPAELPQPHAAITCELIEKLALERREEIVQVNVACEVVGLEVEAQKLLLGPSAETFASGSDLHADPVARGSYDGTYRPGGVTVEMPPRLYGQKKSRVEQACHLHDRATSVVAKTQQLVLLEARDTYHRWLTASVQAEKYRKTAEEFRKVARTVAQAFQPSGAGAPTLDDLIEANYRATRAQLDANEARYQAILALLALERITAGGICAELRK